MQVRSKVIYFGFNRQTHNSDIKESETRNSSILNISRQTTEENTPPSMNLLKTESFNPKKKDNLIVFRKTSKIDHTSKTARTKAPIKNEFKCNELPAHILSEYFLGMSADSGKKLKFPNVPKLNFSDANLQRVHFYSLFQPHDKKSFY